MGDDVDPFQKHLMTVLDKTDVHFEAFLKKEPGLHINCVMKNYFCYFSNKTYVVGTQKNCLSETVLLSTQNICLN